MGEPPHADEHPMRVLLLIPKADPPTLSGEQWSPSFRDFVAQCLQMDAKLRPPAKELLRHRWIRSARKSSSLAPLVERYELLRADRPGEPASYNARRAKPAYSAPAVLAPDGSWDFGPTPDPGWELASDGAPAAPPLVAAAAAAVGAQSSQGGSVSGCLHAAQRSQSSRSVGGDALTAAHQGQLGQSRTSMPPVPVAASAPPGIPQPLRLHEEQHGQSPQHPLHLRRHGNGHGSVRSRNGSSSHTTRCTPQDSSAASARMAEGASSSSCVHLVVAPVLARMLGVHQDKQVQKAIAQLKLAFDNLEKQRPALSRDMLMQMFELVGSSRNPEVASLMPPSVTALISASNSAPSGQGTHQGPLPPGWPPTAP